mmetsp:Transcript_141935/g.441291  ORF Transcript_141935/g.441291 Transcript_141935/m.441291 type:complete len:301 (-) Transcript_141935:454-1356(-)
MLGLELGGEPIHERVVEVLPAKPGVATRGQDLEDAALEAQHRHIEGAASEVVDEDVGGLVRVPLLVQAVGQGRRRGLVDDAQHLQPGDGPCVLGGLSLRVVEVRGDSDDGLQDGAPQALLGDLLHPAQDHGADLLGREALRVPLPGLHLDERLLLVALDDGKWEALRLLHDGLVVHALADDPLHVEGGGLGVLRRHGLRGVADQPLSRRRPSHVGRHRLHAVLVCQDLHAVVAPDADAREGGAEVDADDGLHVRGRAAGARLRLRLGCLLVLLLGGGLHLGLRGRLGQGQSLQQGLAGGL